LIGAQNLLGLVKNTAPFLFDRDWPPAEFLDILRSPEPNYFALCLAAHHATVATFVPTDVDAKIRGLLWRETSDRERLRAMADLSLRAMTWDLSFVSRRTVDLGLGPVSGHDGERLSVIAGAHGRFLEVGDAEYAEKTALAVEAELERERATFARAAEPITAMKVASSIAHNLGDLNQGISFWRKGSLTAPSRARFERLGHDEHGIFALPMKIYRELLSPEGHRNYPLRGVKALRQSPDLLYPQPPFVDDWGALIARHPLLDLSARREVIDALIEGCRKIPGQQAYFRAIAGFESADPAQFERVIEGLPNTSRKEARAPEFRKKIAVSRISFESAMTKRLSACGWRPARG
jgi:hypothetical protein